MKVNQRSQKNKKKYTSSERLNNLNSFWNQTLTIINNLLNTATVLEVKTDKETVFRPSATYVQYSSSLQTNLLRPWTWVKQSSFVRRQKPQQLSVSFTSLLSSKALIFFKAEFNVITIAKQWNLRERTCSSVTVAGPQFTDEIDLRKIWYACLRSPGISIYSTGSRQQLHEKASFGKNEHKILETPDRA